MVKRVVTRGRAAAGHKSRKPLSAEVREEIRAGAYRQIVESSAIEGKYAVRSTQPTLPAKK